MRLYFILFIFFLLVSFSFQKTVLAANHVKENTGKCIKGDCINGNGTFDDGVRIYTGQFKDGKYSHTIVKREYIPVNLRMVNTTGKEVQ